MKLLQTGGRPEPPLNPGRFTIFHDEPFQINTYRTTELLINCVKVVTFARRRSKVRRYTTLVSLGNFRAKKGTQ